MDWRLLLFSLGGVLGLAGLAWLLGLGGGAIENEAAAAREAEDAIAGFEAARVFLSADRQAALVTGAGDFVLLKVHGAHVAARRLDHCPPIREAEDGLLLDSGETMFGPVRLQIGPEDRDAVRALV